MTTDTPIYTLADLRRVHGITLSDLRAAYRHSELWPPTPSVKRCEKNEYFVHLRSHWNDSIKIIAGPVAAERARVIYAIRSWAMSADDAGGDEIEVNTAYMLAGKIERGEL